MGEGGGVGGRIQDVSWKMPAGSLLFVQSILFSDYWEANLRPVLPFLFLAAQE